MSEISKEKPALEKPNICLGGRLNQWVFDHNHPNDEISFRNITYVKTDEFDENGRRIWMLSTLRKGKKANG